MDLMDLMGKSAPGQAIKGALKGVGALTGCSGNEMPTSGQQDEVLYPEGSKVCYNLGSSQYRVTLLEPMLEGRLSTLAEFENGKRTMIENNWVTPNSPGCNDEMMKYIPEDDEDDDASMEYEDE